MRAHADERRDAIDRIAARYPGVDGKTIIARILDELDAEMRSLVEVEVETNEMIRLPAYLYDHTLTGKLIPHSVSPGPMVSCRRCGVERRGCEFVRVALAVTCRRCAEAAR